MAGAILVALVAAVPARSDPGTKLRIATYNVALYGERAGQLAERLSGGQFPQAAAAAEVIQRVRPDVLLLNEIDYEAGRESVRRFIKEYLGNSQGGQPVIDFPWFFTADVNTGVPTGMDLEKNGRADDPGDCFGYGRYPGQYGMAVLSRLPIRQAGARTFRLFPWKDLPGPRWPADPRSGEAYYTNQIADALRLSSKSHWDVPLEWQGTTLHFLVSHPAPPVFDGPEDRNGCRNFDELRFWADYIDPDRSGYIVDDRGRTGGLALSDLFVIAGDLNADPHDGEGQPGAIAQLLHHPRMAETAAPRSEGAVAAAALQTRQNQRHRGDAAEDTADFGDASVGNLRVDYVLPSRGLRVVGSGVFWPVPGAPGAEAATAASDHRLVWIDVER